MKYSEKVVIIPIEKYNRLKICQEQNSGVNSENSTVQQLNGITDSFLEKLDNNDNNKKKNDNNLIEEGIISSIPKYLQNRARTLLEYIKNYTDLSWNIKGEIITDGTVVHSSHIVDLLKDSLTDYKDFSPVGIDEFYRKLKGVPLSLIYNKSRRANLQQGRGQSNQIFDIKLSAPPPGIPIKKSLSLEKYYEKSKSSDWKLKWGKLY
jgi:hypothetical protein